jgi:EAL and modified HD-GYP domain-containing signal transduction protein
LAVKLGFSLFQGYFFSKPVTLSAKALSPLKISYMNLLSEINSGNYLDYRKLAATIRNDVALSYKLLKLVNSAYFGLRIEVKNITQAITILGTKEIRKWIFMIALMGLSSDKPDEIVKMSMIRGRFLENLNIKSIRIFSNDSVFQTGLFSMLDVLMDMPMVSALEGMYLADEVFEALVERTGVLYMLLELATSLERSDWDKVDELTSLLNIDTNLVSGEYLDAIKWCNEIQF